MAIEKSILLGINEISTIASTSESGDFVDDNLLNQQPSELWKASSAVTQVLSGALTGTRVISGIAFGNHNMTAETLQLELATDSGYTDIVLNQTWDFKDIYYGWGQGTWGNVYSTWGGFSIENTGLDSQFIEVFDGVSSAYYRVTITDPSVAPEGGVLFLGEALQSGVSRDPQIPVIDPSSIVMTRGQAMRSDNLDTYREIGITFNALTTTQAHAFRRICRNTGKQKLVAFSLQPGTEGLDEVETKMVARMVDWQGPTRIGATKDPRYTAQLTFREAL